MLGGAVLNSHICLIVIEQLMSDSLQTYPALSEVDFGFSWGLIFRREEGSALTAPPTFSLASHKHNQLNRFYVNFASREICLLDVNVHEPQ